MGLSRIRFPPWAALWIVVLLLACGRDAAAPLGPGDKGAGGEGGNPGGSSGSGGGTGVAPPTGGDAAPGAPAYDLTQHGQGVCTGSSLEEVISAVHMRWPALADIKVLYSNDPNRGGDGSFIHAFAHESGFALAFKRGGGDCPSGCTENEYWYFVTDTACAPMQVGHFSAAWGTGNCLITVGTPMWDLPRAPDPALVCGADNSPTDVSGVYNVRATGTRVACTEARDEPQTSVTLPLTLSVVQVVDDLSRGTVTLQGSGHPLIDGQPIPATFTRRRFTAAREVSNLPATCLDEHSIQIRHDFESGMPGRLEFFETRSINCPPSQGYCKGQISLELTLTR